MAVQHHQKLCFCNLSGPSRRCKNKAQSKAVLEHSHKSADARRHVPRKKPARESILIRRNASSSAEKRQGSSGYPAFTFAMLLATVLSYSRAAFAIATPSKSRLLCGDMKPDDGAIPFGAVPVQLRNAALSGTFADRSLPESQRLCVFSGDGNFPGPWMPLKKSLRRN